MTALALANTGSFRDPTGKVYELNQCDQGVVSRRILRGVDRATLEHHDSLMAEPFYQALVKSGKVVRTRNVTEHSNASGVQQILSEGWNGVLDHEEIPFISYPYEWSFSMLQAAAWYHRAKRSQVRKLISAL